MRTAFRNRPFAGWLFLAALLVFALPAAAQTRLWFQSDPGDSIGQGQTTLLTAPADPFLLQGSSTTAFSLSAGNYLFQISAPAGSTLGAGPFENATAASQASTARLSFDGNGNGCSSITGRFVVLAIAFNQSGGISSLAVDFEQHCQGAGPALWGELRYNSALPLTIEKPAGSTYPDNFTFGGQTSLPPQTLVTSGETTIYGINAPAAISVTNGEYSVNGGPFTALAGTVVNRAHVRVRGVSPEVPGDTKYVTLSVGENSGAFVLSNYESGTPQTGLVIDSFPGDFVGQGQFTFAHAPDWILQHNQFNAQQIDGTGPSGRYFRLTLRGPNNAPLALGAYEDAARAGGAGTSPGLDLTVDGRSCNEIYGRFAVLEIDLNANPKKLAVNFEQWCDDSPQPLFGELRMNSAIPYFFQMPAGDSQPDPMALGATNPVRPGSLVYSNYTRIYGANAAVPIAISGGAEYSVNNGAFTSAPGTVFEFDLIRVRMKASVVPNGLKQAVLDAGGTLATFPVRTYAPGTLASGISYVSSPGDFIGRGASAFHPAPPATVSVTPFGSSWSFFFDVPGGISWQMIMGAANGAPLAIGTYENAIRSASTTNPGLDFHGNGRGCNQTSGRFTVHDVAYAGGNLVRLAVDFEQQCETNQPPLRGQLRYNTAVPFSRYLAPNLPQDMSGEGLDDLLWQHTDGRHALWLMNGTAPGTTGEILGAGTGWAATHGADFDADGKTDLVWEHTDGRMAIYLMNGMVASASQQLLNAGSGWTVTHAADFNGDGKADLVFRHTDGSIALWTMNGLAMTGGATLLGPGSGWSVSRTGDFDGDGRADLLFAHADGRVAIWLMNGTAVGVTNQILNAASGWSVAHVADFSGDGKADIVWQHTNGSVAVWLMNGAAMATGSSILNAGSGWSVVRTADFDGDGKADLFFQHTDGRAAIWLMDGLKAVTQTQILNPASGWSVRRVTDLDGDGRADIIWRHNDGRHAAWLMFGTAMISGTGIIGAGSGWSVATLGQ